MLFEELIEHHRVDRFVAHTLDLAFVTTTRHQIGIHFFHFLGDESPLWALIWIKVLVVAEGNRFEHEEHSLALSMGLMSCL